MTEIGERLGDAIKRSGTVRAFSAAMSQWGVRGGSRRMIHSYLAGTSTPSLQFLEAAAAVLDVSEVWLVLGKEPMRSMVDEDLTATVEAEWEWIIVGSETIRAQLHALLNRRIVAAKSLGGEVDESRILEWAQDIRDRVKGPWDDWTRGIGSTEADWYNYRVAMVHALMLALPDGYVSGSTRQRKVRGADAGLRVP